MYTPGQTEERYGGRAPSQRNVRCQAAEHASFADTHLCPDQRRILSPVWASHARARSPATALDDRGREVWQATQDAAGLVPRWRQRLAGRRYGCWLPQPPPVGFQPGEEP